MLDNLQNEALTTGGGMSDAALPGDRRRPSPTTNHVADGERVGRDPGAISLLLADDHASPRHALALALGGTGFRVVGEAGTTDEAIDLVGKLNPTVAILDIDMPGLDAFSSIRQIRQRSATHVLVLTAFPRDRYIESALEAGATGFCSKKIAFESLVLAIKAVAAGEFTIGADVRERVTLPAGQNGASRPETRLETLTGREREVLRYLALGMPKKQIAKVLNRSVKTVENHTAKLMERLDIHDRVELSRFAIREGLIEP